MPKFLGPISAGIFLLASVLVPRSLSAQNTPAPAASRPVVKCSVRDTPLTPGDIADARDEYAKAIDAYREESKAATPEGERAHTALVRTLIEAGKTTEADAEAHSWLAAAPRDSWAKVAVAEVQWRQGDVTSAVDGEQAVLKADPCNPQAHSDYANMLRVSGMFASAARQIGFAHTLDPIDDEIAQRWVFLQPRAERAKQIGAYLDRATYLDDKRRARLTELEAELEKPSSAPCRLVSPLASTTVPFRGLQDGPDARVDWGLNVSLNGKERRLLIDTGASGITLTRAAANALHLQVEEKGAVRGIGNGLATASSLATVNSIKIGGLEFQDCRVEILEKSENRDMFGNRVDALGSEDGLIGGDVFRSFLLTLDFPGHALKLDPLPPRPNDAAEPDVPSLSSTSEDSSLKNRYIAPSMASWTKVLRDGHELLIAGRLSSGPVRYFLIDSGARVSLISTQIAKQVTKLTAGPNFEIRGLSGEIKKTYGTAPFTLDFADLRYPARDMVAVDDLDIGGGAGIDVSGILGTSILHQLTVRIDYRDDLVNFSYDPRRLTKCVDNAVRPLSQPDCVY